MAIDKVREYFRQYHMEGRIQEFDVSSATVELAAEALHCEPCRIAKTLSFLVGGHPVLIVMAGDARIDNAKFKARFQTKAKMLTPEEVEHWSAIWWEEYAPLPSMRAWKSILTSL